jgi:hypothetical protein
MALNMSNDLETEVRPDSKPHIFKANGDLQLAEYVRSVHYLWVPPGVTVDQVMDSKCFVHIANKLKPNDEIILRSEDDAFYAKVLVRVVRHLDVVVTLLEHFKMKDKVDGSGDSEYDVSYINGRYKWGFKHKGVNDWIAKEFQTQEEALIALNDHRKALAA